MNARMFAAALCLPALLWAQDAPKARTQVKLVTSYGPIVVELEEELAPVTCANFLRYVDEGFYAGTIFHRVIAGFMVQGGGLTPDLKEKDGHGGIRNEAARAFAAGLKNTRGTIAMARTEDPDSASSQFYINTADNAMLDPKPGEAGYCAFGRVVSGMEAVDKIEKVTTVLRRGMQDVPEVAVRIKSAARAPKP